MTLDAIDGFIQSVCPNLDIAMRKLANWLNAGDALLAPTLLAHYEAEEDNGSRPLRM